jgi:methylated-DNA-[protein]-cysteine S-methyltransferase
MYYTRFHTPFCEMILVGTEEGLTHLHLNTGEGKRLFEIADEWVQNHAFFSSTMDQITDYCSGKRKIFNLTINPRGTEFQKKVWRKLTGIPYGELRTYKEIAEAMGNKNSARAVGMANSRNPIPLIIPCHRVIGTNGKLVGFAHGLAMKERLIHFERAVTAHRILSF